MEWNTTRDNYLEGLNNSFFLCGIVTEMGIGLNTSENPINDNRHRNWGDNGSFELERQQ